MGSHNYSLGMGREQVVDHTMAEHEDRPEVDMLDTQGEGVVPVYQV